MSKQQKAIDRLSAKPPPKDFTWSEMQSVLAGFGYKMLTNGGSRRKFVHAKTKVVIVLHEPHPAKIVSEVYVSYVAEHLREQGMI